VIVVKAKHEANIGEGRKTVHVVSKYLSRSLVWGADGVTEYNHPISQLIHGYTVYSMSFRDDVNVILLFGVSFIMRSPLSLEHRCYKQLLAFTKLKFFLHHVIR
jgi:hypothetical protein